MGRPELRYEGIKHDMQVLFHDPKAGADLLIRRLKAMDRDTLKAIVASRKDMSQEDAEHVVSQIEHARDEAIAKYEHMKTEVQHRMEDAKDKALHEAEEARQVARTAAWWTFGSALVSAAAAIVGGFLSTYSVMKRHEAQNGERSGRLPRRESWISTGMTHLLSPRHSRFTPCCPWLPCWFCC